MCGVRFLLALVLLAGPGCNQILGIGDLGVAGIDGPPGTADGAVDTAMPDAARIDCAAQLVCPPPNASRTTLCGELHDLESGMLIAGNTQTPERCDPANPAATGPCSLELAFHDASLYASNPATAPPLTYDDLYVDDCGRFRATNVQVPGFGAVAITVDDAPGVADTHRLSGIGVAVANGEAHEGLGVYAVRSSTDQAWKTSAGLSGTQTFVDRGVYVAIFRYRGQPVSGVQIVRNGAPITTGAFYFDDPAPVLRNVDTGVASTGADGAVLVLDDAMLTSHSGTQGNLISGCEWPSFLGQSIPNTAVVQVFDAVEAGTTMTPCP